jgi:hypothetical protein
VCKSKRNTSSDTQGTILATFTCIAPEEKQPMDLLALAFADSSIAYQVVGVLPTISSENGLGRNYLQAQKTKSCLLLLKTMTSLSLERA